MTNDNRPRRPRFSECSFETVVQAYLEKNYVGRSRSEVNEHARETFNVLLAQATEIESRRTCPRPKEALKRIKTILVGGPTEASYVNLTRAILELRPSGREQMSVALQDAADASQPSKKCTIDDDLWRHFYIFINATDTLLSNTRRGRKPSQNAGHHRLRSDYIWLTGRRPDWTNDSGLRGGFIEFQKAVYGSVGILGPSESMLRGSRS